MIDQNDILSIREQIQEDLMCFLEAQFDANDLETTIACQIVVDNFDKILKK